MTSAADRRPAQRWAEVWQRAWEARETDDVVSLYHSDCAFSTQPFRTPYRGTSGVRDYVQQAFDQELGPRVWVGEPIVDGDRAALEWWASVEEEGRDITLAGTSVLRFDDAGLVVEQRDTWNQADGRREPPAGWGR